MIEEEELHPYADKGSTCVDSQMYAVLGLHGAHPFGCAELAGHLCVQLRQLCICFGKRADKAKIKARIEKYQMCIHTMDLNEALDCIDPADARKIRLMLESLPMISGETPKYQDDIAAQWRYNVMEMLVRNSIRLPECDSSTALVGCLENMRIQVDEISKPSGGTNDQALVSCVVEINLNGETGTTRAEINLVKRNGQWYIDLR